MSAIPEMRMSDTNIIDIEEFMASGMPEDEVLYDLADLFKTFSDTTRIKILYALMEGEQTVTQLSTTLGISQSGVSHQLRTLKQSRLVKFTRNGKNVAYSLADDHVFIMLKQGLTHVCE